MSGWGVRRTRTIKPFQPPNINRETWVTIAIIARNSIIDNIVKQKQASGAMLKRNRPATQARKRAQGKALFSLMDEKLRFVGGGGASWAASITGKGVIVEPSNDELRALSRHVQNMGYTGWLALNRDAIRAIAKVLHDYVLNAVKKWENQK